MSIVDSDQAPLEALVAGLRDGRFAHGLRCPHCGASDRLHRWGRFAARQRYRCLSCRRTFSDLTRTPAWYAKKLELWPAYAACLGAGLTVRQAARRVGIHPSSAFRWRHRLLQRLKDHDSEMLDGWIEVTFLRFAHSEKGSRRLRRVPRRHRLPHGRRLAAPNAMVLVACDRLGSACTALTRSSGRGPCGERAVEAALGDRIATNAILAAEEGKHGSTGTFARRRRLVFHDARRIARNGRHPQAHVGSARAYGERLLRWIRRFRGVATVYLPNYLAWHLAVDLACRRGIDRRALRWPLDCDRM